MRIDMNTLALATPLAALLRLRAVALATVPISLGAFLASFEITSEVRMVTPLENVAYDVYSLHEIVHINEKTARLT